MRKLLKLTAFLLILIVALASSCQPEEFKEIEYEILPTSLNFDATGGEAGFTVSVKSPAIVESVESLSAWCQVSANGGSPVNVIVKVDSNHITEPRNTSVVVNMKLGENKASTIVQITQGGAEIPILEWVLIDGIKWATRNVDAPGMFAAKPEDPGMFYQWDRKVGWSSTDPLINSDGGFIWDGSSTDGDTWEKANDPCPPGWRVPIYEEQVSLLNSGSEAATLNGIKGRYFGNGEQRVFFPAVGYRRASDGKLYSAGIAGGYWNSTPDPDYSKSAYHLGFFGANVYIGSYRYSSGHSVRCVLE